AELNGLEIGAVDVEQGQCRVAVGTTGSVARMVPVHARADVVTELSEVGPPGDKRAQVVRVRDDRVAIGVPYPESLIEQALLVGTAERVPGMVLAVEVERDAIAVVADPAHRGLDLVQTAVRDGV